MRMSVKDASCVYPLVRKRFFFYKSILIVLGIIPPAILATVVRAAVTAFTNARSQGLSRFSKKDTSRWRFAELMPRQLIKGNEAVVKGAILAGCRFFFGYPITPASEIAEAAAYYMPLAGGTFLQAESEIASINMVYGAASGGVRAMTASSSPGISLKQEGIYYCAGSELPLVVIEIMRGGPGLGNIAPEQSDYNQMVKDDEFRLISSIQLEPEILEQHNRHLQAKYARAEQQEVRFEEYQAEDAELILVGYGVVSRILYSAVDNLRAEGLH